MHLGAAGGLLWGSLVWDNSAAVLHVHLTPLFQSGYQGPRDKEATRLNALFQPLLGPGTPAQGSRLKFKWAGPRVAGQRTDVGIST